MNVYLRSNHYSQWPFSICIFNVSFKCLTCSTFDDVTDDVILPLGWVGSFFLGESQSRIYPNICAKFGCGPTVESKKGGVQTDRQTDRQAKGDCNFI